MQSGHCVWYGICNKDLKGMQQYCSYNGTAKILEPSGVELLKVYCPHFVQDDSVEVCCDKDQVRVLKSFEMNFYIMKTSVPA